LVTSREKEFELCIILGFKVDNSLGDNARRLDGIVDGSAVAEIVGQTVGIRSCTISRVPALSPTMSPTADPSTIPSSLPTLSPSELPTLIPDCCSRSISKYYYYIVTISTVPSSLGLYIEETTYETVWIVRSERSMKQY